MIITYLAQLAMPLAWLGTAWRVIQQGFIDMEKMFQVVGSTTSTANAHACLI